jgi:Coenzyme PQQ synthesis protein D (PqqD)
MSRALAPSPFVVVQPTESGAVLLDIGTGECFELNELGVEVWSQLVKTQSLSEIAADLAKAYDAPISQIEADVRQLVEGLIKYSLVISSSE